MRTSRSALMVAAMLAAMSAATVAMPAPRKGGHGGRKYKPTPPHMDTAQQREVAEHNAEVERKRQVKLARKAQRGQP